MPESLPSLDVALAETAPLYERVKRVIPAIEWSIHAPKIAAINRLKRQRNAVILAHNYQTPEIFHGVADIVGDSLALARRAAETDADVIVMGVPSHGYRAVLEQAADLVTPERLARSSSTSTSSW